MRPVARSGRRWLLAGLFALAVGDATPALAAEQTYQTPEQFVSEAFEQAPPAPQLVWLTGELGQDVRQILGHPPEALRIRYWRKGAKTAWVLNEIGKEQPITAGFVVDHNTLRQMHVLIYRESRGWEVRHEFFARRFVGAGLDAENELDVRIDNISGATLSVNALRRLARVALRLHAAVTVQ